MKLLKVCDIQAGMELWSCLNSVIYPLTNPSSFFSRFKHVLKKIPGWENRLKVAIFTRPIMRPDFTTTERLATMSNIAVEYNRKNLNLLSRMTSVPKRKLKRMVERRRYNKTQRHYFVFNANARPDVRYWEIENEEFFRMTKRVLSMVGPVARVQSK
jgi:hypothetical protein